MFDVGGETIPLDGGGLVFWPAFLSRDEELALLTAIKAEVPWVQSRIRIAGREIPIPRLNAWYGEPGADYGYSGVRLETQPWTATLQDIKERVEQLTGERFNSALLNLYRNESDSVDWHADDEPELGANPVVASVSLGEQRCFELRKKRDKGQRFKLDLPGGSLLLMTGELQHHWHHRVAKEKQPLGERVNITFRTVHNRHTAT